MAKYKLRIFLVILLTGYLLMPSLVLAQHPSQRGPLRNARLYRGFSNYGIMKITVGAGTSTYFGDLCESADCISARPNTNIGFNYRFTGKTSLRGELSYYRLAAKDLGGKNERRNLSFRTGSVELSVAGVFEFFSYNKFFNKRPLFNPYTFAGIGVTYINPRAELNGKWYSLAKYNTENINYSQIAPVIPFGGGVQISLSPVTDLSIEVGYRKLFTDYLDDVSTVYTDNALLRARSAIGADLADRTHEITRPGYDSRDNIHWNPGHKRGNPDKKDGYLNVNVKLEYTLNPLVKPARRSLKFKKPRFSKGTRVNVKRKKR